jgi:Tol biopolymer transport system component
MLPRHSHVIPIVVLCLLAGWHNSVLADDGAVRLTWTSATDRYPDWSPDGSKIAFFSSRAGNYEIYTIDVENAGITPQEPATWGEIKAGFSSE